MISASTISAHPSPPGRGTLGTDDVHVWRIRLDAGAARLDDMNRLLAKDEILRARRLRFDRDRVRYTNARAGLKIVLSRYLNAAPDAITIRHPPNEKPTVADEINPDGLTFNLSHSDSVALCALALEREVGVDVERIRPEFPFTRVADRFLSDRERTWLLSVPETERARAFFTIWTRKEAYAKGRGDGLRLPFDEFSVFTGSDESGGLVESLAHPHDVAVWSIRDLGMGPHHVAAVATEGQLWDLSEFDLGTDSRPESAAIE